MRPVNQCACGEWYDTPAVRPVILDLFCGAGGASMGYHRAGWDVVGVDINPQPDYPFDFRQADALEVLRFLSHDCLVFDPGVGMALRDIAAIHASPPCQENTRAKHLRDAQGGTVKAQGLDLIEPVRAELRRLAIPYVIENVPGAPLHGVTLCGSSFGLGVRRHRVFESNVYIPALPCDHKGQGRPVGVYHVLNDNIPKGGKTAETLEQGQEAMGIDWMPWDSLKESIPPAYTEHIGHQLLGALS